MAQISIQIRDNAQTKGLDFEVALSEQFNPASPSHRLGKYIIENIDRIIKEMGHAVKPKHSDTDN